MLFLKSCIFTTLLCLWTLCVGVMGSITLITFSSKIIAYVGYVWAFGVDFLLRIICGVTVKIKGLHNIPKHTGFIVASKHQSAWETIFFLKLFKNPVAILKKELTYIPIYGWYLPLMGMISIDRNAGRTAIKQLTSGVEKAVNMKRAVFIFPEGTRTKPGQSVAYKSGIAAIHNALPTTPIVPAALNSGLIWPAKSFLIQPGVITIEFLKPISNPMDKNTLLAKLEHDIESASLKLLK